MLICQRDLIFRVNEPIILGTVPARAKAQIKPLIQCNANSDSSLLCFVSEPSVNGLPTALS